MNRGGDGDADINGNYYWIIHEEEIYFPGKIVEVHENNQQVLVENMNGNLIYVPPSSIGEMIPSINTLLNLPHDLIEMDSISQPAVYFTLRARFLQDLIYTSLGDILLIVNPFKLITNPSMSTISVENKSTSPHPYLTAARAYAEMISSKNSNQTILIGGESGSGKTETTKTCLSYLSHLSSQMISNTAATPKQNQIRSVEERIMASNPLLEAFGNAKTIRNDNSSRFGKYLEIIYSTSGQITASRTTSYLLEKCRVHRQNSGERNYHIFYQICRAIEAAIASIDEGQSLSLYSGGGNKTSTSVLDDQSFLMKLRIMSLSDHDILTTSGCVDIEGVNDCHGFLETEAAASTLGFSLESVQLLISTCAAILHLGNIQFVDITNSDGAESCILGGPDDFYSQRSLSSVEIASELLNVDSQLLSSALRVRKLFIRGEHTSVHLSSNQANEARDSICKTLYSNLFDWIVRNVTVSFSDQDEKEKKMIGILDIFGFEIFDVNYFEQLCINYANEKLQQFFNMTVFKSEQSLYETEGIPFGGFVFADNQDVLNLIEDKSFGILSIIDDEINIPRANDSTLLRKLLNAFVTHTPPNTEQAIAAARFSTVPLPSSSQEVFIISHYAGSVEYRIDGFLDTSRDKVSDDLLALIESCCDGFFTKSTPTNNSSSKSGSAVAAPPSRTNAVRSQTLGKKFKVQLESLLNLLTTTNPHYIKCIKPNTMKVPNCFQGGTCFAQLQALGVFEAVAIRKRGFPCRTSHEEFIRTYGPLFRHQLLSRNANHAAPRQKSEIIVTELNKRNGPDPIHHFLVGKTKIFSKFEARDAAKKLLDKYHLRCAIKIQSLFRGFSTRLSFCEFCYAALDANTLLSVPDPDNDVYLNQVNAVLERLANHPYQHYQRLLEMKSRISERTRLLKEIEEMQHVSFNKINSKWMSTAQFARKKGINTPAAERVYEMYDTILRGGDDSVEVMEESHPEQSPSVENKETIKDKEEEDNTTEFKELENSPLSRLMCTLCRQSFECPPLKRSPRYLSCLHIFCSVCLSERIERSSSSSGSGGSGGGGGGGVMCPNSDCRVLSRCPDGISTFKIAYALVHQLPPICRNCEQKNAVCKCHDCPPESGLLCMICLKSHNKIKVYKKHTVTGLDSDTEVEVIDMSRCVLHPEKNMDTYCKTCQQLVCLNCAVFNHPDHQILPNHQAAESERNRLLPCLSELLTDHSSLQAKQNELIQAAPALEEQTKIMNDISQRLFQGLHLSLANRRTDFLSVLDLHYSQKRKALVEFTDSLNFHITCQEGSSKICTEMLEVGNDTEVLSVSSYLNSHLDDMIQHPWQQDLTNIETTLSFSCGPEQEVKNLISSIGICRGSTICADPTKSTLEVLQIGEFCQHWQVFIRLTLRNLKGQRIVKGGHVITIDVEEINEPGHSPSSIIPRTQVAPTPPTPPPVSATSGVSSPAVTTAAPPLPSGLGKSYSRSVPFALKSAQNYNPHTPETQSSLPDSSSLAVAQKTTSSFPSSSSSSSSSAIKTKQFTTGLTDNQDGTYHLLVTHLPTPSSSQSELDPSQSIPSPIPEVIRVGIKIFGVHVTGSPLIFHPHNPDEMNNHPFLLPSSTPTPNRKREGSDSLLKDQKMNENKTEFTSVTTFLKYISGGFV